MLYQAKLWSNEIMDQKYVPNELLVKFREGTLKLQKTNLLMD
jgi:hypothetical protein